MDRLKPLEHGFKAFVFRLFAPTLRRAQGEFHPLDGTTLNKVLFLRPEKIGDMVISFPVFDALRHRYPHIKQSILGSPRNVAIIRDDPRFDCIFLYTKRFFRDVRTVRAIRREKFDCVVDMICDDSVTALFLSQLCAPGKPRIGIGKVKYREFYDFNYDHRKGNTGHIIENTAALLEAFGIDSKSVSGYAPPYIDAAAQCAAHEFIRSVSRNGSRTMFVGYNLSAGSPTRIWAKEKSVELLKRIQAAYPEAVIILTTAPPDRGRATDLAEAVGGNIQLSPPGQSLVEASALLAQLSVLISPDTAPVHIARSFRVPVVGLYSRFMKNFLLWRPYDQGVGAVVSDNDGNIFDITVDQVFEAFQQVMKQQRPVN